MVLLKEYNEKLCSELEEALLIFSNDIFNLDDDIAKSLGVQREAVIGDPETYIVEDSLGKQIFYNEDGDSLTDDSTGITLDSQYGLISYLESCVTFEADSNDEPLIQDGKIVMEKDFDKEYFFRTIKNVALAGALKNYIYSVFNAKIDVIKRVAKEYGFTDFESDELQYELFNLDKKIKIIIPAPYFDDVSKWEIINLENGQ